MVRKWFKSGYIGSGPGHRGCYPATSICRLSPCMVMRGVLFVGIMEYMVCLPRFTPCVDSLFPHGVFRCTGSEYTFFLLGQKENTPKEKGHEGDALLPLDPLDSAAAAPYSLPLSLRQRGLPFARVNKGYTSLTTGPFAPHLARGPLRPMATVGVGQSALRRRWQKQRPKYYSKNLLIILFI